MTLFLALMTALGLVCLTAFFTVLVVVAVRAAWDCAKPLPPHRRPTNKL